ncbi:TetR/AcrR family transcriptional regulator [Aeromicrobium sp. 9AM]|uniref:TetR/AcrR family transcriptional regulator n=1 Tax=Aeromicrobium sp. 9AM TaxID=2653126 RepID=UPI0012F0CBA7|nr:TetR/AcrR family transcriptional regulator [Aeromicrobium sp. 9AM]VXB08733.1 Transcriptional regulator, TetR family [Aeromicrobium sp. 9AM]
MSEGVVRRSRRAGGERRAYVLDHAIAVVAERGLAATRYADVAEASGIAVSTLQGYFGSREDMLIEAFERATVVVVDAMNELASQCDGSWQQLVAMVDQGLSTPAPTWRMLMEFWTAAVHDAELQEHAAALAKQYREPYVKAVQLGTERGAFSPRFEVQVIVESLVSSIVGLLYPVVLGHFAPQVNAYREIVLAQLAFALRVSSEHVSDSPSGNSNVER